MDYEFEHLSRAFMDAIYKVRDKASLLELACALLKAKAAVLVDIFLMDDGKSQKQISERFPKEGSIPKIDPGILWEWVEDAWHPEFEEGLTIEKGLQAGDCSYSGGLIAFGEKDLICPGRQQAMIVLQNGQATGQKPVFLSYHSWVASNLLKFYEFNLIQKKNQIIRAKAATEERQKNYYMQYASGTVLPNEKWEDLIDRIQEEKEEVRPIYHGIWILYQIFRLNNQNKGDRESLAHVYKKDRREVAGRNNWIKDLKEAIDYYTQKEKIENGNFAQIIQWMMDPNRTPVFDDIDPLIKKAGLMDGIGDKGGIQPLQDHFVCHLFYHLWLDVMHQAAISKFVCRPTETKEGTKKDKPSIQSALFDHFLTREKLEIDQLTANVTRLMKLTNELFMGFLDSPLFQCSETGLSDWGREALRIYLAIEITGNSSRMEQLYLDKEKTQEHGHAPEKLRQHFILNLARFMISVLMICLGRQNIHLEPEFRMISRPEELDSLLYPLCQHRCRLN